MPTLDIIFRRVLPTLARLLAGLFVAVSVHADDPPAPPPLWSGEGVGSWVQTTGNSSSQSLGAGLTFVYEPAPWKATFKSAYIRTRLEGVTRAEKLAVLLRAERALSERVSFFSQASALRDTFAGLDGQETLEAGATYKAARGPKHILVFGGALGYTTEQRPLPAEDLSYPSARLGLAYKWVLSPSADLSEEANALSDLSDGHNWRLTTTTALTASFSRVLALRVSHQLAYVNAPVPGKKSTDTTVLASVVAKWPAAK